MGINHKELDSPITKWELLTSKFVISCLAPKGFKLNAYKVAIPKQQITKQLVFKFAEYFYSELVYAREVSIVKEIRIQIDTLKAAQSECEKINRSLSSKFLGRIRFQKTIVNAKKAIYTYNQMIQTFERCLKIVIEDTNPTKL